MNQYILWIIFEQCMWVILEHANVSRNVDNTEKILNYWLEIANYWWWHLFNLVITLESSMEITCNFSRGNLRLWLNIQNTALTCFLFCTEYMFILFYWEEWFVIFKFSTMKFNVLKYMWQSRSLYALKGNFPITS